MRENDAVEALDKAGFLENILPRWQFGAFSDGETVRFHGPRKPIHTVRHFVSAALVGGVSACVIAIDMAHSATKDFRCGHAAVGPICSLVWLKPG